MSSEEQTINRLKQFKDYKQLSFTKMGKALGIDQRTFNYYFEGRRVPACVLEKALQVYPELSAEWLMRGEGDMLREDDTEKASTESLLDRIEALEVNNHALRLAIEALTKKE